MESTNNTLGGSGIHCKVCWNDHFRRFLFNGTEFRSLQTQIQQLLGLDKEFVLKYKDNEGDLITISTNEELTYALTYSEGKVLRLTAIPVGEMSSVPASDPMDFQCDDRPWRHGGRGRGKYRGRGGRCGRWGDNHSWKEKLMGKKEKLQKIGDELSQLGSLTPQQQRELSKVQDRLRVIDDRLANGDGGKKDYSRKCWEKEEKKEDKNEKKEEKKEKKKGKETGKTFPL